MESTRIHGRYVVKCLDENGTLQWQDTIENVVTTVGKNFLLDTIMEGSGYSATGPFMGLISSVSYSSAPAVGDTMASHSGWKEVSASTYFPTVAARLTTAGNWDAAAGGFKANTIAVDFEIITNPGTIKGCFLVMGDDAVDTLGSTAGVLYSAGLFTTGDKAISVGQHLTVTYTAALS